MQSRFFKPSIFRTSWLYQGKLVSLGFDFSRCHLRFFELLIFPFLWFETSGFHCIYDVRKHNYGDTERPILNFKLGHKIRKIQCSVEAVFARSSGHPLDYSWRTFFAASPLELLVFTASPSKVRAPEGGLPYKNDGGARRKFSKKNLKGTRISIDGLGLYEFFSKV